MNKRFWSIALAGGLVASALVLGPAKAQTVIPDVVQITDPVGDANTQTGDQQLGQDLSSVGDLMNIWFSNTDTTITLHIQTEAPPPAAAGNIRYNVYANPVEGRTGTSSCLRFEMIPTTGTGAYMGDQLAKVQDRCVEAEVGNMYRADRGAVGELKIEELGDGTGLMSATFPRAYSEAFAAGKTIEQPFGIDYIGGGTDKAGIPPGVPQTNEGPIGFSGLRLDDTKIGTDFVIASGGPVEPEKPAKPTKPTKKPKPGKGTPKGCDKGKGKKKGCPTPPPAACPAMTPAEAGKDKPTITLTDAATEAAPLEQKVTLGQSVADLTLGRTAAAHDAFNFQVDSEAAERGVYVLITFPARNDYDLNMMYPDGSYAARSHAWNTIIELNDVSIPVWGGPLSSTGHGGESTASSEKLVGIKVADCSGWTLDVANYLGQGGEATVQLWLGEATTDPQEQGAEPS